MHEQMVIARGNLRQSVLSGKTVLLTGAGGGIGYEAARSLVYLGANVVLAEIDPEKGRKAEEAIAMEFSADRRAGKARFFAADISREEDVCALAAFARQTFGKVDILINNATVTPMGMVHKVGVSAWDKSYGVHLRAAVLLLEAFLPEMLERDAGTVVFVPSSGAAPYMGAYEVFKAAQVELCNTLAAELEDTGVVAYSIGPGLVKTDTALAAIRVVAANMGMSADEFIAMNETHLLSAEEAGAGFAASAALAQQYRGKEVSSIQALIDAGILNTVARGPVSPAEPGADAKLALLPALEKICFVYDGQYDGWLSRNIFERQWVLRDFKKSVGFSADIMQAELKAILESARAQSWSVVHEKSSALAKLGAYYAHQLDLLRGYEKDPAKRAENEGILQGWIADIESALTSIKG